MINGLKKNKNLFAIISVLTLFSVFIFKKTLFNGEIFAWYNDQLFQHNVFYKEWYRIIKETMSNHVLAVYSWNTFLGSDYLASKLMYCVGDFLITPFFIFYNGDINYDMLFAITTIISIVLSGANMYIYLRKYKINKQYLLVSLPIIYALGGFVMTYTGTYMFHRFYCLLPLLFYFCEVYIQNNRLAGFSFIVAILFMQSYELLFTACFFLILYFIQTYKLRFDYKLSEILKRSIPLIFAFFVGILLCGAFLIPLILFIKSNSRVAGFEFGNLFWDFKSIVGFFSSMVVPAYNYRSGQPTYLFYGSSHYGSEYGLFSTVLFILAFIVLIRDSNKNEKRCWVIGEIIILICLLFRPFNSIIHGFSLPTFRWSFLLELYHLLMVAYVFENYELKKLYFKEISIVYVCYIALYVIFILVYKIDIKDCLLTLLINIGSFGFLYVYSFLLNMNKKTLFSLLSITNVMVMYAFSINATYGTYGEGESSYNNEYLTYFIENDEDVMFRIYFDSDELWPYSWLNLNDSINNDYLSTTTYDSTYNAVLTDFLTSNGYDSWMIDIDDLGLLKTLGVKYYISTSNLEGNENLEYCTNINNFNVYKIIGYNHIGYTNNGDQLNVIEYNRQYIKGSINVKENSTLFVAIPYSDGWTVKDQNGKVLNTKNINGGFLGVDVDENVNELCFYYGTPGLKIGLVISFISLIIFIIVIVKEKTNIDLDKHDTYLI